MMRYKDEDFKGEIGRTVDESVPWWPSPKIETENKPPNIVFIVLDDLGFAQLGCYGSNIFTPNIDKLAFNGIRYNNFHTTAMCSPTRASLLTGRNPHSTGVSFISDLDTGFPNSRGKVRKDTVMLSEMLVGSGYNTFAYGKWHLMPAHEQGFTGPFDGWPLGRGFEHFYGFLGGFTDQYNPDLVEDNRRVPKNKEVESGYHLTEDITNKAIEAIKTQRAETKNPFFCYLAYAAPHAPHQVPKEYIDKYKNQFDKGWDKVREEWFKNQKKLGIIPENTKLPPRNPGVQEWEALSEDEKKLYARMQEVFAGFLEHTDFHIGRLIQTLEELGEIDNTIIVFLSDNGACSRGGAEGIVNTWLNNNKETEYSVQENLENIDLIGSEYSKSHYPAGWAQAGNTPLKWYKTFTHAGGVKCPLIIHYPEKIKDKGAIRKQYHHVTDIVPTILDLVDIESPKEYKGVKQKEIHGTSLVYSFSNEKSPTRKQVQHYEIVGNRAIWKNGWKAVTKHEMNTSFDKDDWELYNTDNDFSESENLSEEYPEILEQLIVEWWKQAEKYDVFPLDGRTFKEKINLIEQKNDVAINERIFYSTNIPYHGSLVPSLKNTNFYIQSKVKRNSMRDEGVIFSFGDQSAGIYMFIKNNKLYFHYNFYNKKQYVVEGNIPPNDKELDIIFMLNKSGDNVGVGNLYINGERLGSIIIEKINHLSFTWALLNIGKSYESSKNKMFQGEFVFDGEIEYVKFTSNQSNIEEYILNELLTE